MDNPDTCIPDKDEDGKVDDLGIGRQLDKDQAKNLGICTLSIGKWPERDERVEDLGKSGPDVNKTDNPGIRIPDADTDRKADYPGTDR